MRLYYSVITLCFLFFSTSGPAQHRSQQSSNPNIVLIFVDDWAWNGTPIMMDVTMANSRMPVLQMPNLEKLSRQGMRFRNAYSGAPQCSPSRVALQTGQSSPRNGFTVYMSDGGSDYYDPDPAYSKFPVVACVSDMTIDEDAVTIPKALNPLGYVCAHLGKWHVRGNPEYEGYAVHDGETTNKEGNQKIPGDPKLMFSMTEKAIDFMEDQVQAKKPFYLQISHYAMHKGYECLPETREKYVKMPEIQAYYRKIGQTSESINKTHQDPATYMGMAEDMDGRIGAVMDKIKELGIEENTYLIMVSDNGYRRSFYHDLGLPQPLHGAKWWIWQAGLRVPMIVIGPDIQPGTVCNDNVINYDFLPTFVEWAGGNPGDLKDIDGVSLAGIMRGEKADQEFQSRNLYFHYPHYRNAMPVSAMVSGDKKVMHFYEAPEIPMLFDVANDKGEVKNIASTRPVEHKALYTEMMQYLEEVDARMPKENPDYDPRVYKKANEFDMRVQWGPFRGERPLEEDEK
ncbi:MAG: sulfatase [Bacteroidales bacterium]